jgi:hypothetical protein
MTLLRMYVKLSTPSATVSYLLSFLIAYLCKAFARYPATAVH